MEKPFAVEVVGYLSAAVGVGEAARRYVDALRTVGVEVRERDVSLPGRDDAGVELLRGPSPSPDSISFNLVCLNPEQMVPYLNGGEGPRRDKRQTVGIWSWEVDLLPPGWCEAAAGLDDIWTYSSFSAGLIESEIGVPVQGIPPPVCVSPVTSTSPVDLPQGFRVLVMFDFLSTLERKNPLGAIEAFKRAFQPEDDAALIVKSINGRHRPERQVEIRVASEGRPDIVLLDQTMSGAERDALIAACDCCLSLHRSEGHGLPLAEAMLIGRPVVATAYGGNTEFMSESNSYLVAWNPAHVGDGVEHYPSEASWAEPDIEHAASLLRAVRDDPQDAARRAARGQADVLATLAPEAVGGRMRARFERLESRNASTNAEHLVRRLVRRRCVRR
jgi:glycosyltransferase involved in cell wall biosynthesis